MSLPKTLSVNIINQLNAPPETTALQKVFILIGFGTFVALAALTASLPLNVVSNQGHYGANPPATDAGDTAWMIVAAFFAILVAPAVSYVYGNLYGRTGAFSLEVSLLVGAMISVLWIVLTFSLTYAKDANNDQILGFPRYYYMFAHVGVTPDLIDNSSTPGPYAPTVPFSIFAIFELAFPVLAATLVVQALIDRVNIYGLMFFLFVWHICIYTPIAHITWNVDGFFKTNQIEDFAGGLVVHMTAGITAAIGHLFLNWIKAPAAPEAQPPKDPESLIFGGAMVWFLWFGLNAGKAWGANFVATQAIVNTIAAVATSVLVNYFLDILHSKQINDVAVVNAILLGLIASSPSCGYVTVGGSMVVSVITVLTVRVLSRHIIKETAETYSIASLHGIGGSTAFLFTALISYKFVNPGYPSFLGGYLGALNGQTYGMAHPIRHHTAAVLAMWICLTCTLLVAFAVCNLIVPLNKERQGEKGKYAPTPLGPAWGSSANAEAPAEQPAAAEEQPAEA